MSVLDNLEQMRSLDPDNMYNRIFDFPEQMADALALAQKWPVTSKDIAGIGNIVVIGMGGSAIGGDLVRSYLSGRLMIPFTVCRHYLLPEYVDDETLVIASSYSGNTEETLAALDDALGRKAMIAGLTTGGMLAEVAKLNGFPCLTLPGGLQPRAALGYSFVPILILMEKLGLIKDATREITGVIEFLKKSREQYIEDSVTTANPAKKLATSIHGRLPIIYAGPTLTDTVGVRWKGQMCENGKTLAFASQYAEFNHNELVGWSQSVAPHVDHLAVIQLRDADDHPRITRRMDIVHGIVESNGVPVYEIKSSGSSPLQRMFSLIQLGDFVSYYLAILNSVDPTPVDAIEKLKQALAKV
ncbi:MAG: bifunctional phosphoglucose/phosphomannose isomerase [candidate division Zixibacteria bacterium]|nr:bifunctional phosphoglucose/phosphomannose isomerase [candidate division Zixibacteria bacterium]